jgi:hypothetical protein
VLKTLTHLISLSFLAANSIYNCTTCPISQTFMAGLFRIIFNTFLINAITTIAALSEIALSYDRLLMFRQNSKWLIKIPFNVCAFTILLAGIGLNIVYLMAFRLEQVGSNRFAYVRSYFGSTAFYRVYAMLLSVIQSLLSFIVLLTLNIIVAIDFKKYIKRKNNLTSVKLTNRKSSLLEKFTRSSATLQDTFSHDNHNRKKKKSEIDIKAQTQIKHDHKKTAELNFTAMIIFSSLFFTFTRFILLIATLSLQLFPIFQLPLTNPFISYIVFSSQLATFVYFASNLFTYLTFNRVFRARFRRIFSFAFAF